MNKELKKAYRNHKWQTFAYSIKKRDKFQCTNCHRNSTEVILQVHHTIYRKNTSPWKYPSSDCITLCKGCHARTHNLIEPITGWILVAVNDLEDLSGICERNGCGNEIRYEHEIYHPNWGYKTVGSSCVESLTIEDKKTSSDVLKIYIKINNFIRNSKWEKGVTKKEKVFIETKHSHHKIRIYGKENSYGFQIIKKELGARIYTFQKTIPAPGKTLAQVKELAYIFLKGQITDNLKEKEILRNICQNIKKQ